MKTIKKVFGIRAIIATALLSIINVFSVSAHHAKHHASESSHLLSHILIGIAIVLVAVIAFAYFNRQKLKSYFYK